MYPRWHIILGGIFSLAWKIVFPETAWIYIAIIFLASFLIDFDHYAAAVIRTGRFGLGNAIDYFRRLKIKFEREVKRGIRRKGDVMIFHTIEFHLLVLIAGLFWTPMLYVFIGMVFHSLTDLIYLIYTDRLFVREFWLFNAVRKSL